MLALKLQAVSPSRATVMRMIRRVFFIAFFILRVVFLLASG